MIRNQLELLPWHIWHIAKEVIAFERASEVLTKLSELAEPPMDACTACAIRASAYAVNAKPHDTNAFFVSSNASTGDGYFVLLLRLLPSNLSCF
jgi:hypothetical protein